ncbi:hypothetical protein [Phyllobacterium lublinensis]|uniref:hypothetical protein n=1 Tax=Phyllobacterium lublinensis TaxID=2875708 RepID=UPI001CCCF7E3|nr:hypothetical protein [Phyllobacterium sp. 2063]MBZ9655203.1 hypothetical protein [Phyllobacterium sp. 2063]
MNKIAAIIMLLVGLSIGWVPVFASPSRLTAELSGTPAAIAHMHHSDACSGKQHHCPQETKQLHPPVCAACIGVPAISFHILAAAQPRTIIPRGEQLPLVARVDPPLPRPPRRA